MKPDIICRSGKGTWWTEELWMLVMEEHKLTGKYVPVARVKELCAVLHEDGFDTAMGMVTGD